MSAAYWWTIYCHWSSNKHMLCFSILSCLILVANNNIVFGRKQILYSVSTTHLCYETNKMCVCVWWGVGSTCRKLSFRKCFLWTDVYEYCRWHVPNDGEFDFKVIACFDNACSLCGAQTIFFINSFEPDSLTLFVWIWVMVNETWISITKIHTC